MRFIFRFFISSYMHLVDRMAIPTCLNSSCRASILRNTVHMCDMLNVEHWANTYTFEVQTKSLISQCISYLAFGIQRTAYSVQDSIAFVLHLWCLFYGYIFEFNLNNDYGLFSSILVLNYREESHFWSSTSVETNLLPLRIEYSKRTYQFIFCVNFSTMI